MIYGITKIACTCMCACEFPDLETCSRGREGGMDFNHATEKVFFNRSEGAKWATAQKALLRKEKGITHFGTSVRKVGGQWLAEVSWNE